VGENRKLRLLERPLLLPLPVRTAVGPSSLSFFAAPLGRCVSPDSPRLAALAPAGCIASRRGCAAPDSRPLRQHTIGLAAALQSSR
jgi:hypothetical protein